MTGDERQWLRAEISRQVRLRVGEPGGCTGCGGELDSRTAGCLTCYERLRNRERRRLRVEQQRAAWFTSPARRRTARSLERCWRCGCRYEERTAACPSCRERHKRYRRLMVAA